MSVWRPAAIASQPRICAEVGVPIASENQRATTGWNANTSYFPFARSAAHRFFCASEISFRAAADIFRRLRLLCGAGANV